MVGMRFARILLISAALAVPLSASALKVPFVGSPFAHMSVLPLDGSSVSVQSQTAAAANPGEKDICYSVSIKEVSGSPQETYSQWPDDGCETLRKKYASDKAACQNAAFRDVVGDYSYTDTAGNVYQGRRCDHLPGSSSSATAGTSVSFNTSALESQAASIDADALHQLNPQNTADQAKMVDMYKALNVPEATAQTMVSSNPQGAYNFLDALSSGDQTRIEQSAKEFQLNPSTVASPGGQVEPGSETGSTDTSGSKQSGASSQNQCGLDGWADGLARAESDCGRNPNTNKNCGTGKGGCGVLQIIPSTYNSYLQEYQNGTGDMSCAGTNAQNSACSIKIVNYHSDQWLQSSGGQNCTSAGLTQSQCVYGAHWMGEGGVKAAVELYKADPNGPATALCSSAAYQNCSKGNMSLSGLTMKDMFQALDSRTGGGGGPSVPPPVVAAGSGGAPSAPASNIKYVNVVETRAPSSASGGGGNNAFGSNSMQQMMQLMMMQNMMASMTQRQQAVQQAATQQQAQQQAAQQAATPPPTLTLTAQPSSLTRGNPITVSWNSTGMSTTPPCTVTQNGTQIGQGNAGAVSVATASTTVPGTIIFRLGCQAASNGQVFQQNATVLLQ